MKNKFWKFLSLILFIVCVGMGYLVFRKQDKVRNMNEMSLKDVNREDFEYKKKQSPAYAKDLNDYFFKNPTTIQFLSDLYDFDTLTQGEVLTREIRYINTGDNPYFITDIKVSCGCTIPTYLKEPIKKGDTGTVSVQFDSKNKNGFSMNKLSLFGNTEPNEKSVYFKVYIKTKNR